MATVNEPTTQGEKISMLIDRAGRRYTSIVAVILLGGPIVAYLSGDVRFMFYAHITLGGFWFGLDFFFKYVMLPGMDESNPEAVGQIIPNLTPKIMVMADGLTIGTIGAGILLAHRVGMWANPSTMLLAAVVVSALMFVIALVPLHIYQADLVVELLSEEPDPQRVERLNSRAGTYGFLMTILMLLIFAIMTGLRWDVTLPF